MFTSKLLDWKRPLKLKIKGKLHGPDIISEHRKIKSTAHLNSKAAEQKNVKLNIIN